MPKYTIRDPRSNRTVTLTGDAPPSEAELHQIFARLNADGALREATPLPATATAGMVPASAPDKDPPVGEQWPGMLPAEKMRAGLQWAGNVVGGMTGMGKEPFEHPKTTLATAAMGAAAPVAKGVLPNAERAGQKFQQVMAAAKNVPIDTAEPGNVALRISQLAERGGTMPKSIRDFLKRATDPNKPDINYEEARDFYGNISRLSADEMRRLPRVVKREVAKMRAALDQSIERAAGTVGQGENYRSAMTEYARAAKMKDAADEFARAMKKWLVPTAVGAYAYDKVSDVVRGR